MIRVDCGLFNYRVSGYPVDLLPELEQLYPNSISADTHSTVPDFDISIAYTTLIRQFLRPQVSISIEGHQPFNPVPPHKLLPSLEWSMNWCVASYDNTKLLIHCGVAVKNNQAFLFPAKSGSGKSTTSTYLGLQGFDLYSDEMAIIDLKTAYVLPVFRPSSLKNESIEIIRPFAKQNFMSSVTPNTHKGNIAHVRTMTREHYNSLQPAKVRAVIDLDFNKNDHFSVFELEKSVGFAKLISNGFNYKIIGESAFNALVTLINGAQILEVSYSQMSDIKDLLDDLQEG